ncbi:cyclin-T2-like [Corythoichthys intestinalis]|uniref:cyclin-T2-like n=1 Tax=Corythoichthys intestinalis TaxID=161448 RepID=UPI0025A61627|nr:cyclin-T2-like [Corythoichthys intestinalis]XP_061803349.1 cyclin-T2-like [Nerophis lumbriciformis]
MAVHRGPSTKWLFTREQLENTPSRRCGIEADRELSYRQQAANLIQDIGQRLIVSQLIINTAIVYMHRFYMIHSLTKFHRNIISQTTLFLAAKVEEQPRKLEDVIKKAHACINPQEPALDTKSNAFHQQSQELVALETIVLQTLGFEITIDHPHTDVVRCSQLVRASKDLAQTSYFMATNSLHLTTFCLQYRPTVVACVCIHLACKWSNWEIPVSTDGKHWWEYVDRTVTLQLLDELTHEFLQILEKTPSRLKRIRNWRAIQAAKKPKTEGASTDGTFQGASLDNLSGVAGSFFPSTSSSDAAEISLGAVTGPYASYQPLGDPFSQPSHSDFTLLKHEHKTAAACNSLQPTANAAPFLRPQKVLTLEKYREKQAAELAMHNGVKDEAGADLYAPPAVASHHHKKRCQVPPGGQSGEGRREKSGSKKTRAPVALTENGSAAGEELKMRIKVSSERHGGSDQGKDKHKEYAGHRHSKHGHSHPYSLGASASQRAPGADSGSGSSRKRPQPDGGRHHNHHHSSKSGRSSKAAVGSSRYSDGGQRLTEHHGHDGTNGLLTANGQHTDYKDTFDMLDSLLSAQGMNL